MSINSDSDNVKKNSYDILSEKNYKDILVESETRLVPPALDDFKCLIEIDRKVKVQISKKVANVAVIDGIIYKTIKYKSPDCRCKKVYRIVRDEVPFKTILEVPCSLDINNSKVIACILDTVFCELKNKCNHYYLCNKKVASTQSDAILIRIAIEKNLK